MRFLFLISLLIVVAGCATRTRQTDRLVKDHSRLPVEGHLSDVPFIEQKMNHCGPATLAMVLGHKGKNISVGDLAGSMMIKNLPGTFQADMLLEARRRGLQTLKLTDLEQILAEVSKGHPVIVFQNLGFSMMPKWHYAVVTGYDLRGPDVFLHSGNLRNKKTDMRFFERSWILGGHWALLLLRPEELSETGSEIDHVNAISHFENLKDFASAKKGYETILSKWPRSLPAYIGLGNVNYHMGDKHLSMINLKKAVSFHQDSAIAWHNLATVQGELGRIKEARLSAKKAIELSSDGTREQFRKSLKAHLLDLP